MHLIAHNGPNWSPGALAVQRCDELIAIGVRNNVVLYDFKGLFCGEIRGVGRGRVTAISFCEAEALTHLLAVGTSEGFVRIYDVQTRRLFRKVKEPTPGKKKTPNVLSLKFVDEFPNMLIVVTEPNQISLFRYETAGKVTSSLDLRLDLQNITCVTGVPGFSNLLLAAGVAPGDGEGHAILVDVSRGDKPHVFHKGVVAHDLVISVRREAMGSRRMVLALILDASHRPLLYESLDGITWSPSDNSFEKRTPTSSFVAHGLARQEKKSEGKSQLRHHCCGAWCGQQHIVVSDARGTIILYEMTDTNHLMEVAQRQSAHTRQIFSMKPLKTNVEFVSISMDRTVALWMLDSVSPKEHTILLRYRTPRSNGPIQRLVLLRPSQLPVTSLPTKTNKREQKSSSIGLFTTIDTITCVKFTQSGRYSVIGEISPFGNAPRKQKSESLENVVPIHAQAFKKLQNPMDETTAFLFTTSRGRIGLVRLIDGELEYVFSRKHNTQNSGKEQKVGLVYVHEDTAITSISGSGALETVVLPLSNTAWNQARMHPNAWPVASLSTTSSQQNAKPSAACVVHQRIEHSFFFCVGYEDGSLCIFSFSGQLVLGPLITNLARLKCIAYTFDCSTIVASDCNCKLVTVCLRDVILGHDRAQENKVRITHHRQGPQSDLQYLTWSPPAPANDISAVERITYLVGITGKGEILAWVYQEDDLLELRAHIKAIYGRIRCCAWESYSCLLSGGEDGSIRKWELEKQPWPCFAKLNASERIKRV